MKLHKSVIEGVYSFRSCYMLLLNRSKAYLQLYLPACHARQTSADHFVFFVMAKLTVNRQQYRISSRCKVTLIDWLITVIS